MEWWVPLRGHGILGPITGQASELQLLRLLFWFSLSHCAKYPSNGNVLSTGKKLHIGLQYSLSGISASSGLQIDEQEEDGNSVYVNLIMRLPSTSPLSSVPCGQCPVIGECAEGNDVSPSTCQYMTAWLEF